MAADTKVQLTDKIEAALDAQADVNVSPDVARRQIAVAIANAINDFVIGRTTTGTVSGSTATTKIQ